MWLAEWLAEGLDLRPGMRVLDLGCGRALSSIFLHREFGVQVWAADLWFSPDENLQRIREAGVADGVFPLHLDARSLPFAAGFFDAIVSHDSFVYYGTDAHYLGCLVRFLQPGGQLGIAGAGLMAEIDGPVPAHLQAWWTPDVWCLHSAAWWRTHWERTGLVTVEQANTLPDGWRRWLAWQQTACPDNTPEIEAVTADAGRTLGYVRVTARRTETPAAEVVTSIPMTYHAQPLKRDG